MVYQPIVSAQSGQSYAYEAIDARPDLLNVFVNLHPSDLLDDTLYSVEHPMRRHAARIVLEITERSSLESISDVRARVARLREVGFRIVVDDLGAGYSGLTSFVEIEPEVLKLDMSLVRDVDRHGTKRRLIRVLPTLEKETGTLSSPRASRPPASATCSSSSAAASCKATSSPNLHGYRRSLS